MAMHLLSPQPTKQASSPPPPLKMTTAHGRCTIATLSTDCMAGVLLTSPSMPQAISVFAPQAMWKVSKVDVCYSDTFLSASTSRRIWTSARWLANLTVPAAVCLIIVRVHMIILIIIRVKLLVLIEWSLPQSCWLLNLERLACFEHVVQSLFYTRVFVSFLFFFSFLSGLRWTQNCILLII
jgi:hypothetical protein